MAVRVKVSKKNQIALSAEVREQLVTRSGHELLLEPHDGCVVLLPEPSDYAEHLRGLHRDVWEGTEPQEYVRHEREGWQK